mmetsp:Transcript_11361/g.32719  ORF Transcript_11361/g.32719 Transcript_11361/m.32719 type:complete len:282 (-) Transcript_11361:204-1049(-)|eukprot:CAMPEP_0172364386 /NCGR_PEP_ID=MMETSP1060-20121228/7516_1 /TAXON_ID=37318 /ORGANISM="Pseudo-nitzschia pungens, Strain cf. cingulata" /LENGTH=281 /DNA_ID=CAMNT_0013087365 /DNA_START=211 /DNA_END=1056 /DNA_ORIENTATION=-
MIHPAKQINQINLQIANGEYDEAIVSLTNTLKVLKLVLSGDAKISIELNNTEDDENANQSDSSPTSPSSLCSLEYDFFSSPASSSSTETTVNTKECDDRYRNPTNPIESCLPPFVDTSDDNATYKKQSQPPMFRDPIMVRGDIYRISLDKHVCEQISYVALYNIALSHHLKALQLSSSPSCQTEYLQKALSLYEHFYQVLMKQTADGNIPITHAIALLGNIGQIHWALGNKESAEMCFDCLLSRVMYLIVAGQVDQMGKLMEVSFDMILPILLEGSPAPAA